MPRRRLLTLLAALVVAPSALAAQGPVFGLRAVGNPKLGYFVYAGKPGAVLHGAVTVTNTGDRAGTAKIYAADATTGRTTGAVYLTEGVRKHVGTWIKLNRATVTLKPGARARVGLTVTVPGGSDPGQYVGGVVAEATQTVRSPRSKRKANVQIRVRNLSIVAIQVNLPGQVVSTFTIGKVSPGGSKGFQQVVVHIANEGNVLRKPVGSLVIENDNARIVERATFRMDTFLPHTAIDYPVPLKRALAPGSYTAKVRLSYPGAGGGTKITTATRTFDVSRQNVEQVFTSAQPSVPPPGATSSGGGGTSPWVWVAVALGAAGVVVATGFLVARRRSPSPARTPARAVACGPVHDWEIDHSRGANGRFVHRCRNCGLEVAATSRDDAGAQAEALQS